MSEHIRVWQINAKPFWATWVVTECCCGCSHVLVLAPTIDASQGRSIVLPSHVGQDSSIGSMGEVQHKLIWMMRTQNVAVAALWSSVWQQTLKLQPEKQIIASDGEPANDLRGEGEEQRNT